MATFALKDFPSERIAIHRMATIPSQVAGPDAFCAKMTELEIGDDALVMAYDDYDHIFAGRLAWALRYYGHDAVRILDGGWSRWIAEARPTTRDVPRPAAPSTPFVARVRSSLRVSADEVAAALDDPTCFWSMPALPTSTRDS